MSMPRESRQAEEKRTNPGTPTFQTLIRTHTRTRTHTHRHRDLAALRYQVFALKPKPYRVELSYSRFCDACIACIRKPARHTPKPEPLGPSTLRPIYIYIKRLYIYIYLYIWVCKCQALNRDRASLSPILISHPTPVLLHWDP